MSNRFPPLVCIGAATLDAIVVADVPLPVDARIAVEQGGVAGGGPAATAAVAIARQGLAVAFAGRIGDDEAGGMVASSLEAEGVDTRLVQVTTDALTAFSAVVVDRATANRLILTRPGPLPSVEPRPELVEAVRAAEWVHVDQAGWAGWARLRPLVNERADGPLVSVDGGNPIPDLDLSGVALYAPSEAGIRSASGIHDLEAAMRWALDAGAALVVVTRGRIGSIAMARIDLETPGAEARLRAGVDPSAPIQRIEEPGHHGELVSTLGAGDVFHGLLLAAIRDGGSVRGALRAANVGAALSCRGLDGRSAIPDREELAEAVAAVTRAQDRVASSAAGTAGALDPLARAFGALARPSGTFAMVAIDQRESLRAMLADDDPALVSDAELVAFKREVMVTLADRASALLLDRPLGLSALESLAGVSPGCGLILAADVLDQSPGGPIRRVTLDREAPAAATRIGAVALKLLVPWRPSESAAERGALVRSFAQLCREAGLLALVEALVSDDGTRSPDWNATEGIVAAATEMADYDFDLYKAQVPTFGRGDASVITELSSRITDAIGRPWVVLSNGVPAQRFEHAVRAACAGGASGFLAGRAIWTSALDADDRLGHLAEVSAGRLDRLGGIVDTAGRPWHVAAPRSARPGSNEE